jgi:2-aminoadipate transaminase
VKQHFPDEIAWTAPQGGLFLWCVCPPGWDTQRLLPRAVEQKVAFVPGDQFFAGGDVLNTMRLNFSNESEEAIHRGIAILGKLLATGGNRG